MRIPAPRLAAAVLLLALHGLAPHAARAQVALTVGAGLFAPLRDLGKATGDLETPSGNPLQVRSGLEPAPLLTGRVEVGTPWRGVTVHGSWSTTLGARAEGEAAICSLLRDEGVDDPTLCTTSTADASVQILTAGVTFARDPQEARVRPFLSIGAGVLRYAFDETACTTVVCELHEAVLQDGTDPMIHFALGLVGEVGPVRVRGEVGDAVSAYDGGGEDTRGETQNDVLARVLVAIPLG